MPADNAHSVGWRQVGWIFDGPDNLGVDEDERFCSLATFAKEGPFREPYVQWMKPCFVEAHCEACGYPTTPLPDDPQPDVRAVTVGAADGVSEGNEHG